MRNRARGSGGLDLVFNVFGASSPGALDALDRVAEFYSTRFADPVTVTIDVTFDPFAFGGTGVEVVSLDYESVRSALVADADPDDSSQALLPVGTFPARRSVGGPVSNETTIDMTAANARALGIDPQLETADAFMSIGSELDFDPSDGVGGEPGNFGDFSGTDILIHEVGHALGFVNFIEFGGKAASPLDLYRFPENGPDNPTDASEFPVAPRALYVGGFSAADQHTLDTVTGEFPLSNASDFQASHLRETFTNDASSRNGVMEPAIAPFENGDPFFFSQADTEAFDAMGWDIGDGPGPCSSSDLAEPFGTLNFNDVIAYLDLFASGDPAADLAFEFGVLNFNDVIAFLSSFAAGCP